MQAGHNVFLRSDAMATIPFIAHLCAATTQGWLLFFLRNSETSMMAR